MFVFLFKTLLLNIAELIPCLQPKAVNPGLDETFPSWVLYPCVHFYEHLGTWDQVSARPRPILNSSTKITTVANIQECDTTQSWPSSSWFREPCWKETHQCSAHMPTLIQKLSGCQFMVTDTSGQVLKWLRCDTHKHVDQLYWLREMVDTALPWGCPSVLLLLLLVCVCVFHGYICVYVCIAECLHGHLFVCICMCVCVLVHVSMCLYRHVFMCLHGYVCTDVYGSAWVSEWMYVCVCVCVWVCEC